MKQENNRELLINALLDLASDEFIDPVEIAKLSKMSDIQLIKELINVAEYWRDNY